MKTTIFLMLFLTSFTVFGQTYLDSTINSATKKVLFADPNVFSIGSYGEAHYNQTIENGKFHNGEADLHRIILFTGYKFNKNLQFFSEIEFEHVHELTVEQAFLNYSVNSLLNFKAGVILIPMGYVNEFHEPTLFNGVERSSVDKYILPSTWHELGFGMHGLIRKANLKYQLYIVNGLNGYNADGNGVDVNFSGKNGMRSARQGGGESMMRTPAITGKLTFFGLNGLRLGISGYYGNTETSMYDGLDRSDAAAVASADSTRLGVAMSALNLQYTIKNIQFTGIASYGAFTNSAAYNAYCGSNVGSAVMGYYGELAYTQKLKSTADYPQLVPFVRYQNFDTHFKVDESITKNKSYNREELTAGLGLRLTPGTILKTDYQWVKNEANQKPYGIFNVGFGYWF